MLAMDHNKVVKAIRMAVNAVEKNTDGCRVVLLFLVTCAGGVVVVFEEVVELALLDLVVEAAAGVGGDDTEVLGGGGTEILVEVEGRGTMVVAEAGAC
jgi:hypothetical protein